jgi:hypothetical protein
MDAESGSRSFLLSMIKAERTAAKIAAWFSSEISSFSFVDTYEYEEEVQTRGPILDKFRIDLLRLLYTSHSVVSGTIPDVHSTLLGIPLA